MDKINAAMFLIGITMGTVFTLSSSPPKIKTIVLDDKVQECKQLWGEFRMYQSNWRGEVEYRISCDIDKDLFDITAKLNDK